MSLSQFLQRKPPHPPGCPQSPAHTVERLGKTVVPISQVRKLRLRGRGLRSDRERHLEAPPPSPSPPGQRHFLLLRGLWGPRAAGGAPNGSWGLCVWQRQLGLQGPNPHSECEWEVGEGSSSWRLALCQLGTSAGWGCPRTVSLCLSLLASVSISPSAYLPLSLLVCFSLCLCLSISLCVCLSCSVSASLFLCLSVSHRSWGTSPISGH